MTKHSKKLEKNVLAECVSFCILAISLLILLFVHFNPEYLVVILICITEIIICVKKNQSRSAVKTVLRILGNTFGLLFALSFRLFFIMDYFLPYHTLYEYPSDIAYYKKLSPESYYFFPDRIPENARKIKWIIMPGAMQGSGYEMLTFQADEAYLEQIRNTYTGTVCIESYDRKSKESKIELVSKDNVYSYHKDENAWKNQSGDYSPTTLTTFFHIKESEMEYNEVIILYEYDANHGFIAGGINIDHKHSRITFWKN